MAIQIRARDVDLEEDMVFNFDVYFSDDRKTVDRFLAEVHETCPQDVVCPTCEDRIGYSALFRGTGTGFQNLEATLTCFDLLRGISPQAGLTRRLVSRLLELQARGCAEYSVCFQIRHQRSGESSDCHLALTWIEGRIRYHFEQSSSCVVPEREAQAVKESSAYTNYRTSTITT